MKTISKITLCLVFLSGVLITNAQNFKFGVQAGTNFAVQSPIGDYYNNDEILTGLHAGIFGNYTINERISLQGEINYDQLGSKAATVKNHFDYIHVPVLFNYSFGKSYHTPIRFDLYAGPFAGYLINSESRIDTEETNVTKDLNDNTNKYTGGFVTGFGLRYPINNQKLMLDIRLGLGLAPYHKNDYEPKNKYIGLTLGYEF